MAAEDKLVVVGTSGAQHEFQVFPWGTTFNAVGGLYLVLKRQPVGNYGLLYVGQTSNLSERFDNHHKQGSFDRHGRTHIAVKGEGGERARLAIESDLVRKYQPPCNG